MDGWVIAMMLSASIILGGFGLWALLWGIRSGQFDDQKKFLGGAQLDSEDALKDAVLMEHKKEALLKERQKREAGYAPPD